MAASGSKKIETNHEAFKEATEASIIRENKFLANTNGKGNKGAMEYHKELGKIIWDSVGMSRSAEGLKKAINDIQKLRQDFHQNVYVPGSAKGFNPELIRAFRVSDFLELGELMARDALERNESCGGHFREEFQTEDGEAKRDDEKFCHVAAWEFQGVDKAPTRHQEKLEFENVKLSTRSYK